MIRPSHRQGHLLYAAFAACFFARGPLLDPGEGEAGGGGGGAAAAVDDDGPPLVRDDAPAAPPATAVVTPPAPAPAAPAADGAPAPETKPAAEASAAAPEVTVPPTPATPAAAAPPPANAGMDKAVQQLQQEMGNVTRNLGELRDGLAEIKLLRQELAAGKAAGNPAPTPAQQQQADDLEKIIADDFEVDVNNTPKAIAKAVIETRRQMQEELKKLREETTREQQARAVGEGQRAFEDLQTQVRAKTPDADLTVLYRQCSDKAVAEGYGNLGAQALRHRATQLFQDGVDRLLAVPPTPTPSAPAAPAPAAAAGGGGVTKPAAPAAPPITPGGAQVRVPNVGGNPRPGPNAVLSDDEIDAKHTLVRRV